MTVPEALRWPPRAVEISPKPRLRIQLAIRGKATEELRAVCMLVNRGSAMKPQELFLSGQRKTAADPRPAYRLCQRRGDQPGWKALIGYLKRLSADPPKPNPILGRAIGLGAILMLTPEYLMGRCNRRMFTRRSLAVETSFSSGPNAKTAASDSCDDTVSTTANTPQ